MPRHPFASLAAPPKVWFAGLGMALLLLALAVPWLDPLDRWAFDLASRRLRRTEGARQVVLVGIDEPTERAYPEPHALWHRHIGATFEALALGRPRAVGVDLTLPEQSFDAVLPGGDAALLRGALRLGRACPLVLGLSADGAGQAREVPPLLRTVAAQGGFVQWAVDPDGVVRRFGERPGGRRTEIPTLVGQMTRALGLPVREGWLDYRQAPPVPYVPMHQVEAWGREGNEAALRAAFEGKAVLLGSVLPYVDRHFQVADVNGWGEDNRGFAPGVLLHVQALENQLGAGPLRPLPTGVTVAAGVALALLGAFVLGGRPLPGGLGALVLALALGGATVGLMAKGLVFAPAVPLLMLLLGYGTRMGLEVWRQRQLAARFQQAFSGFVSPGVLDRIKAGELQPGLEAQKADLCVLFSDIRGFTTLSEGRDPADIIALLNRYFDRMVPCLHAHGGALDKYMGDGIMAHFGHPEALENPCQAAFDAAKEMLAALAALNAELQAEGFPELQIGIGLHAGEAVVGHIGSKERHEYTAIGDTVNTASRIEGITKNLGHPLLLTESVARRLNSPEGLTAFPAQPLKGRSAMEVFGWKPDMVETES